VAARPSLERLIEGRQQGCATPIVDDSFSTIGEIEVATDNHRGTRLTGERTDYICGMLVDRLLFRGAAGVAEKVANCGLTVTAV
jgi:hypothetical protein